MSFMELLAGPFGPVLIFLLRIVDVSMGTLRVIYITRGARLPASLLGTIEVAIWVTVAGSTILNLSSPLHLLAYAAGFGAGTWIGTSLEARIPNGVATVQAFCRESNTGIAQSLRAMGFGVTETSGVGKDGPVDIVTTAVKGELVPRVIHTIETSDPDAFITVYETRARRGWFSSQVRK